MGEGGMGIFLKPHIRGANDETGKLGVVSLLDVLINNAYRIRWFICFFLMPGDVP